MPDVVQDAAAAPAGFRWRRRVRRSVSADSYGLVLLLVVATYVVSVSVTAAWAGSIVLTVQLATVWLTLRASRARRVVRAVASVVLCLAAVVVVVSLFAHRPGNQRGGIFVFCCVLYLSCFRVSRAGPRECGRGGLPGRDGCCVPGLPVMA